MPKQFKLATLAALSALFLIGAQTAQAQSGVTVKEITTADAAAQLLQPIDNSFATGLSNELSENGIDTSDTVYDPPASKYIVGDEPMSPFTGQDGPIQVLNCSPSAFTVHTYNEADTVFWVPFESVTIPVGESRLVKCASAACSLKVDGHGPYKLRTGPQVWVQGDLQETNSEFAGKGCGAY